MAYLNVLLLACVDIEEFTGRLNMAEEDLKKKQRSGQRTLQEAQATSLPTSALIIPKKWRPKPNW